MTTSCFYSREGSGGSAEAARVDDKQSARKREHIAGAEAKHPAPAHAADAATATQNENFEPEPEPEPEHTSSILSRSPSPGPSLGPKVGSCYSGCSIEEKTNIKATLALMPESEPQNVAALVLLCRTLRLLLLSTVAKLSVNPFKERDCAFFQSSKAGGLLYFQR